MKVMLKAQNDTVCGSFKTAWEKNYKNARVYVF